jgi:hypothetical protein
MCPNVNVGHGCAGMLGRVGQRLGDDVAGRDLDRLGQPRCNLQVELDRNGGATGERLDGRAQATLGEDEGVNPAGEPPQILQGTRQTVGNPSQPYPQLGQLPRVPPPPRYEGPLDRFG